MLRTLALLVGLSLAAAPSAWADEGPVSPLGVGDPAPALDIAHWVKGVEMDDRGNFQPVTTFEPGKVYVLEFWATWCGPCRMGMPHLSALQEAFAGKGVVVLGISDESLPRVVQFLWQTDTDGRLQNERTRYTITTDPDGSTHAAYMDASGQQGIPTAFVVGKDGRIEWIGHPMQLDPVLEAVVSDAWDREAFREDFARRQRIESAMAEAQPRLMTAAMGGDWETVVKVFDELLLIAPGEENLTLQRLNVLLTRIDDRQRAYAYAKEVAGSHAEDPLFLNAVAWMIVDDPEVKHRDLDFALVTAEQANAKAEGKDAGILDTLARVHHDRGDVAKAVEWQAKAAEVAEPGEMAEAIRATLERYQKEAEAASPR